MKRKIASYALTAICIIFIVAFTSIQLTLRYGVYGETAVVLNVDYDADVVTLLTSTDHVFEWEGVEDWQEDDAVSIVMFNHFTEEIEDDEIVNLKYAGFSY